MANEGSTTCYEVCVYKANGKALANDEINALFEAFEAWNPCIDPSRNTYAVWSTYPTYPEAAKAGATVLRSLAGDDERLATGNGDRARFSVTVGEGVT